MLVFYFLVALTGLGNAASSVGMGLTEIDPLAQTCPQCRLCTANCVGCGQVGCDQAPAPPIFCRRNVPCFNNCTCLRDDRQVNASAPIQTTAGIPVCPGYKACNPGCVCTMQSLIDYLNPDRNPPSSIICDIGNCNLTCSCREGLLESLKEVLFPGQSVNLWEISDGDQQVIKPDL